MYQTCLWGYNLYICSNIGGQTYKTMEDLMASLYYSLCHDNLEMSQYKIMVCYMNVTVSCFNIEWSNGLILKDSENQMKVTSLYPQMGMLEMLLCQSTSYQIQKSDQPNKPAQSHDVSKPTRHRKIFERNKSIHTNQIPTSNNKTTCDDKPIYNNKTTCEDKPIYNNKTTCDYKHICSNKTTCDDKHICSNKITCGDETTCDDKTTCCNKTTCDNKTIEYQVGMKTKHSSEHLNVFKSDKKSYVQIKRDIDTGIFRRDQIHPLFTIKYQLFQILESRNKINFGSDGNINDEYEIFMDLYNACNEDNDCNDNNKCNDHTKCGDHTNKCNIWVPIKYNYMSIQEKIDYAGKYNMTLDEFEKKYVNKTTDEFENYFSENSESIDSEKSN